MRQPAEWYQVVVTLRTEGGDYRYEKCTPVGTYEAAERIRKEYSNLGHSARIVRCTPPQRQVTGRKQREAAQVPLLEDRWFSRAKKGLH